MTVELEKVDFNNLKKGKKYQIRNDITTGTFGNINFQRASCFFF